MFTKRVLASSAVAACALLAVVAAPTSAEASAQGALPQVSSATAGAQWLAGQLTHEGYIPSQEVPGSPDLSATANTIFALASADDFSAAQPALSYMESNVNSYVTQDGSDGPGQLALLILDAHALGASPTSFGGNDLVSRLLLTEQTSGFDHGLFGTEDQVNDFDAGVYDQGLALTALAAVGDMSGSLITAAESWLENEQCPDGGWTAYDNSANQDAASYTPCNGLPADFSGPDTNSTSLAVQGLSAEGALGAPDAARALKFLTKAQDGDGGWGYEPNTTAAPGSTDPDSTALVIQAILALGKAPTKSSFDKSGTTPVAALESFQLTSGSDSGAFTYPGISGANTIATYQAVPAVADVFFPLDLKVATSSLPTGSVDQRYNAALSASGGSPSKWEILSGSLPSGLKLNKRTGRISGTPRTAGTSNFVVEAIGAKTATKPSVEDVAWSGLSITT